MNSQKSKYSEMTHVDLMRAANTAKPGKEARLIHKELKKYRNGLLFQDRHPLLVQILIQTLVILFDVAASVVCVSAILRIVGFT